MRTYVLSFLVLAFLFVPVLFFFFFGWLLAPLCYGVFSVFEGRYHDSVLMVMLVYLILYAGLFVALAFGTFSLSRHFLRPSHRLLFQIICLLALFFCSFLPIINTGGGLAEGYQSGIYNFWTACLRYPNSPQR